jgi:RNA polymerase sigma-70 factor (ECF subfamily)
MSELPQDVVRWLRLAQSGSPEAMGQALESCRAYLLLVANRELDSGLQAKGGPSDLVQETFLDAQRDFAGFKGQTVEELRAWLRQILLNNLSNFARAYRGTGKRRIDLERGPGDRGGDGLFAGIEPATGESAVPERRVVATEQAQQIAAAVARLPADYRQVIQWRHQEGLGFPEIASRLGRSENAVRKLWFRAVEQLKQDIEAES